MSGQTWHTYTNFEAVLFWVVPSEIIYSGYASFKVLSHLHL